MAPTPNIYRLRVRVQLHRVPWWPPPPIHRTSTHCYRASYSSKSKFRFQFHCYLFWHAILHEVCGGFTKVGYLEGGWVEECAYIVTYYLNDHFEVVSQAAFSFMTTLSFIQWFTSIYVYLFIMKSKWLQQKYFLGWPCYSRRRTPVC